MSPVVVKDLEQQLSHLVFEDLEASPTSKAMDTHQAYTLAAFKALWNRIHNPSSACPDVEIGFVLECMANVLANVMTEPKNYTERRVLAWLRVFGNSGPFLEELLMAEHDIQDAALVIKALAEAGLIQERDNGWEPV
jgi:hypothetical protein